MSTNVENQVVRLRLENDQYERAVSQSIKSAENLEKSLNFKGAGKGLDEFDKNVEKLNPVMEKAGRAIDNFSVKAIAKFQIISRYIDGMFSRVEGFIKSVSIEPVSMGWGKYAEETQSVQTIMAATGKTIGEVSSRLERLSWFTDETSYNLTDMTNNIGKFTSNGVALDKSVTAMEAIAAAAGLAGAGTQNASHAMTGFSKAIAQGKMDRQTWSWIETANMATKQFKEAAIEAGVAIGTLIEKNGKYYTTAKKASEVSYQVFEQTLTDGWMTTDVIMKTLDKFGGFTDQLYLATEKTGLTATQMLSAIEKYQAGTLDMTEFAVEAAMDVGELDEMMKLLSSDVYEVGRKALRAAQEAKTFQEAIDSVKDAVSTKWKDTWKYIFGDYEEARKLWTTVANELYDAFAASGDARNEMLDEWKEMGGRTEGLKSVINLYSTLKSVLSSVKAGFNAVFPMMTGSKLYSLTKRFADFTSKIGLTEKQMDQLQRISKGLFSVLDAGITVVGKVGKAFLNLATGVLDALGIDFLEVAAQAGDMLYSFSQIVKESSFIEDAISGIGGALKLAVGFISVLVEQFFELSKSEGTAGATLRFLSTGFSEIFALGQKVVGIVTGIIDELVELDEITLEDVKRAVRSFFDALGELGVKGAFEGTKRAFFTMIDGIVRKISEFIGRFPEVKHAVVTLFTFLKNFFDTFDFGSLMVIGLSASMMKFMAVLGKFMDGVKIFMDGIIKTIKSMTAVTDAIVGILKGVEKTIGSASKLMDAIGKSIQRTANSRAMINYAIAIGILAASLIALSFVPTEKLIPVTIAIGALTVVLLTAVGIFAKVMDKLSSVKITGVVAAISGMIIAISLLSVAFGSLAKLDLKGWFSATLSLASIVAALAALSLAVAKATPAVALASANLIAMAAGVYAMTFAFKSLSKLDADEIAAGIFGLIGVVAAITQLTKHVKQAIQWKDYAGLIAIAISLSLFAIGLKSITKVDPKKIIENLFTFVTIIAVITTFMLAARKAGQHTAKAGVAILGMTVSLILMATAIKKLSKIKPKELSDATASVAAMIVVFGIFVALSKLAGEYSGKAAWSILAASIGITLLATAMMGLSILKRDKLNNATVAIGIIMGMLAVIVAATGKSKDAKVTLTAIGAVMTTLALILGVMTLLTPEKALQGTAVVVAIGAVLAAIVGLSHFMGKVDWTLLFLAAAMAGLAGLVYLMSEINPKAAISNCVALGVLAAAMAKVIVILSGIPFGTVLPALGKLLAIAASLTAFVGVMGALIDWIDSGTGGKATQAFETFGEAIGGFVGGIIGGIVAAFSEIATSSLEVASERLSNFMKNLEPFFEYSTKFASMADESGGETGLAKAKNIVQMISELVDTSLYFRPEEFTELSAGLIAFGEAAVAYSNAMANFNVSAVETSGKAVSMILDIVERFPKSGALKELIEGSFVDMWDLGEQLVVFASHMVGYSRWMTMFETDAVEKSSAAVSTVLTIAENWPKEGGLAHLSWLFGKERDMTEFGTQLINFATYMVGYSVRMRLFQTDAVLTSHSAVEAVVALAENAPKFGGLDWLLNGDINMSKLGTQMCKFAEDMVEYSNIISGQTGEGGFNADAVSKTTEIIKSLLVLTEYLPHVTSGIDKIFGGKDMTFGDFGKDLQELGRTLFNYSDYIEKLDVVKMESVTVAVKNLIDTLIVLKDFESWGVSEFCVSIGKMIDSGLALGLEESTSAIDQARSHGQSVIDALAEATGCASPSKKAHQIGMWTIEGFYIGLTKGQSTFNIAGIAGKVGLSAINAINEALDIHSPSGKAMKSGEQTVQGYVVGIEQNERYATARARQLANNVVNAFQTGTQLSLANIAKDLTATMFGSTLGKTIDRATAKTKKSTEDFVNAFADGRDELLASLTPEIKVPEIDVEGMTSELTDSFTNIGTSAGSGLSSGAASGIKNNTSPEEAAKEKAEKIASIFDAEISRLSSRISIRGKEFDVWELMEGKNLSETERAEAKLKKLLADAVDGQGQVEAAMEKHAQISKELGEGSEQEVAAYSALLDQQKNLATLINEIQETHASLNQTTTTTMANQRDAVQAYYNYMKEYKDRLLQMGLTLEEVQSLAKKESGWKGFDGEETAEMTDELSKQVAQVVDSATKTVSGVYRSAAEKELGQNLTQDFRKYGTNYAQALGSGMQEAIPQATAVVQTLAEETKVAAESQNENWITVGTALVDNFISGIQSKIEQAAEVAAAMARAAYEAAMGSFGDMGNMMSGPIPVTVGGGGGSSAGTGKNGSNGQYFIDYGGSRIPVHQSAYLAWSADKGSSKPSSSSPSTPPPVASSISFTQNNYSPKTISATESYRLGKNALSSFANKVKTR